jgi:hypothetical protein
MRQARWRGLRAAAIAVALAAVLMNGVRVMPTLETLNDGYSAHRGLQRTRADLEAIRAGSGEKSRNHCRALLNVRQSEEQFSWIASQHSPGPVGGACLGALCLAIVSVALGVPTWSVWTIRRHLTFCRSDASP